MSAAPAVCLELHCAILYHIQMTLNSNMLRVQFYRQLVVEMGSALLLKPGFVAQARCQTEDTQQE